MFQVLWKENTVDLKTSATLSQQKKKLNYETFAGGDFFPWNETCQGIKQYTW